MVTISLADWIQQYDNGYFNKTDLATMIAAGWYDWFCRDSSLPGKLKILAPKVKRISNSTKIDKHQSYVFFKNNYPLRGNLYDEFKICDLESGDVLYCIIPRSGHPPYDCEVWGCENQFQEPLVSSRQWKDVLKFFGV